MRSSEARAVDVLRGPGYPKTYDARRAWIVDQAGAIDLRRFRPELPAFSPRLVQQALYSFGSKSNRVARGDVCAVRPERCTGCVSTICPFTAPHMVLPPPPAGIPSERGARSAPA